MVKQIKFKDIENDVIHGGILLDDGNVVCGCCGGIHEKDEQGVTWQLIKEYDSWVNLDGDILGDDAYTDDKIGSIRPCCCRDCSAYDDCTAIRGTCNRYGGSVDGSHTDTECIHGTGGLLLHGSCNGERDEQITYVPVETTLSPEEFVKELLELQVNDKTPEGFKLLKVSLTNYMNAWKINDFQNVKLRFETDR